MIATAVITAPRPRGTLAESLESYRAAGFHGGVLVCNDGPPEPNRPHGTSYINNPTPLGNLRNWHSALKALVLTTKAEWVMVCEDDITWARNAAYALATDLRTIGTLELAGGFSLYLPARMSGKCEPFHGGVLPEGYVWEGMQLGRKMWGAQCLLFTRAQAERVLAGLQKYVHDQRKQKNIDGWVTEIVNNAGLRLYWRVPCLVDHKLGDENSALYGAEQRPNLRSKYYTGEA